MRLRQAAPPLLLWALGAAVLAGCSGSPQALGITGPGAGTGVASGPAGTGEAGPGAPAAAPNSDDTGVQPPGNSTDFGNRYAPTIGPAYGSDGRYYGYN